MLNRRQFIASTIAAPAVLRAAPRRPNVIVLISDDQGYGDLSLHGNPNLQTPHLDSIGREGVQFTQFQVCPVCSPTRSSLMTGRWNYRTGIVDTYLGRSMMWPDEVTLPEVLRAAGYRTGIFGKWHLGDNYPLRSVDQGFENSLVCKGGGLAQPSGPPGNGYFDPILEEQGRTVKKPGYCTDIFFDSAMQFIETNRKRPFFCYLATNAPHDPLQVDDKWVAPFRGKSLGETTEKVYGMVANLDHNTGRLLAHLKKLDLERDTLFVYLTDNGPQQVRYNANMRGRKGTVYQGGIRVPCFLRWPGRLTAGGRVDRAAAHVDLFPTLAEICGAQTPKDRVIDGRSLWPLLDKKGDWTERPLFTQWHRGDEPEHGRACAVRLGRSKLVDLKELYDLETDPNEQRDLAATEPAKVAELRTLYDAWFKDVSATRGYAPPRIHLGSKAEPDSVLTRQDWRGPKATWTQEGIGHWEVETEKAGDYDITLQFPAAAAAGSAEFQLSGAKASAPFAAGAAECKLGKVKLAKGPGRVETLVKSGAAEFGAHYVHLRGAR